MFATPNAREGNFAIFNEKRMPIQNQWASRQRKGVESEKMTGKWPQYIRSVEGRGEKRREDSPSLIQLKIAHR